MGKLLVGPWGKRRRHARALSKIGKSSTLTSPPVASLKALAVFNETPRLPVKICDKWPSEQGTILANSAWLISSWLSIQAARGCFLLMPWTLPLANYFCQELLCHIEIDISPLAGDPLLMAKVNGSAPTKKTEVQEAYRLQYLGPWIYAAGKTPAEVVRETGINFGYLSGLISGKKRNPSYEKLSLISKFLKVPIEKLEGPPPSVELLNQVADYDPELIARLSKIRQTQD